MDKKNLQTEILEASYQPEQWLEVLKLYFGAKKFHQTPQPIILPSNDLAEMASEIGSFYTADERLIGIYEVKLTAKAWISKNRVGLRNLLRQVYKYDVDGALIVFVQDSKWRFSYVSEIRTEEGKKETEPKRYTYLFGKGESCRTAADRFEKLKGKPIYLADLFDAFSVDKLNKDFFKSYKEFFEKFSAHLASESKYRKLILGSSKELEKGWQDEAAKPIRDFSKKLLGRIVFLQFLQKKGWMGVASTNEKWTGGNAKFLQDLFLNYSDKEQFHSKNLRILFFETLNKKRKNQIAPFELGKEIKVPYLNGGLFDKDISFENDIDFPADLFKNLLEFFESYNFTIDENDPYDSEVGIDPEMLGHIFENLLEENREKGAFYTPKEIVHYMCQESLIQYLRTHLPECTEDESPATKAIENFIRNSITGERNDKKNFVVQQAKRIEKLLDKVKICDPAIGSGAFPMGMLQEIFKAKTALDLTLDHAEVKKKIIQESIYGVDIENGAVEIARLRFWLALVVDESEPQPLPNLDYKIMQGNSLLESFEGINLKFERKKFEVKVEKQKNLFGEVNEPQMSLTDYLQGKQDSNEFDIVELEDKYFNSNDADEKEVIRTKIDKIEKDFISEQLQKKENELKELVRTKEYDFLMDLAQATTEAMELKISNGKKAKELGRIKGELQKVEESTLKLFALKRHEKPYFLWSLYFMDVFEKSGFDIVIGNPPYIQMQKDRGELSKALQQSGYETFERTGDIYAIFYELGFNLLKKNGIHTFITSSQWLRASYGKSLRQYFLKKNPLKLLELGPGIFESAVVDTNILIAKNEDNQKQLNGIAIKSIKEIYNLSNANMQAMPYITEDAWAILNPIKQAIKQKLRKKGKTLSDWDVKINFGIKTGFNEAFIIDEDKKKELIKADAKSAEIVKPILRGREIDKYFTEWDGGYVVSTFPALHIDISKYKAVEKYLESFLPKIKQTGESFINKDGIKENTRKKTGNKWFETQDQIGYYKELSKEKIIWKRIGSKLRFSYSDKEIYCLDSTCIATGEKIKYLTALLNSKLSQYQLFETSPKTGMGDLIISVQALEPLFVYYPNDKEEKEIEKLINKILELKKEKLETSIFENKIDALVFHFYGLTEQEMLQVLDTFKDLSIKDRNQIQNEYWNIANNKFQLEK